ncbi:MAG: alpha/beta fold hydrolase, partial [Gemmatimonadales bacterium]
PGQDLAPRSQAMAVAALLDRLGVGPVDVIANDSGVAVAQLLLRDHPGRVRTLLLTNGDTEPDCPPPALQPVIELARQGRYAAEWLAPWVVDKDLARSATGLGGLTFTRPAELTDAILDDYLGPLVSRPDLTNEFAVALESNALEGMSAVPAASRVPIRLIWGTADPIFSAATPDYYARTAGAWRGVRRIEGAKLFFPEEFPEIIAEEASSLQAAGG